ncbi:hypothetical protein RRG08_031962 [Elysia crispata]|uniref:Uncharacterized protein n=1 Tax=Elysia crispata TaxID=231223 RepID=A0AAE0Z476_9GAST|nr:hypothetical protein RRG08_031962 [Elysia crispata]
MCSVGVQDLVLAQWHWETAGKRYVLCWYTRLGASTVAMGDTEKRYVLCCGTGGQLRSVVCSVGTRDLVLVQWHWGTTEKRCVLCWYTRLGASTVAMGDN